MMDMVGTRTLRSQWDDAVRLYGEQSFLEFVSTEDKLTRYTYRQFDRLVKRCANLFLDLGVEKGELVAIHLHNCPQYLVCWLALAQIGAVAVPLNEHYKLDESAHVLTTCKIRRMITEPCTVDSYASHRTELGLTTLLLTEPCERWPNLPSLSERMEDQPTRLKEDRPVFSEDLSVILFTSGTTCRPKGAMYTHHNVIYGGLFHAAQVGMVEGDRFLSCMPCYHMDFQEMACAPVLCAGGTLIMVEHYSARRFWGQVCRYQAHFTDTMSIMNRTMLMQPVQPWEKDHCLKQIYFSMGLSTEEKQAFEERFRVKLLNSYGMTETVTAVTCSPVFGDRNWPSVGRPALSYEIKIIDCAGKEVPSGELGEICIHGVPGKTLVSGYYGDPKATAELIDSEGWLHSGDRGYLDEQGFLFFVDRWGNMIKRAGENISSSEVECVLTSHSKIADAAVIGVPDPIRDEAVKALVLLQRGETMTGEEVIAYCTERLAQFKVPTLVEFVTSFPRTSTGKIKKQLLR